MWINDSDNPPAGEAVFATPATKDDARMLYDAAMHHLDDMDAETTLALLKARVWTIITTQTLAVQQARENTMTAVCGAGVTFLFGILIGMLWER